MAEEPIYPNSLKNLRIYNEDELRVVQKDPSQIGILGRVASVNDPAVSLDKNVALCFASTQPKKFTEVEQAFVSSTPDIQVLDAIQVLHWFLSADEISKTYEGNTYEKIEALLDRQYNDIGYDTLAARLKERGYDPRRVVFSTNDCGFTFNNDFSKEPEFQRSLHERGIGKNWPDVELGPIMDAQGGIKQFYLDLSRMVERKRTAGEEIDLTGFDRAMYMFFKLQPERKDVEIVSSFAETPVEITLPARPGDGITTYSRHMMPRNDDLPEWMQGKTMEEIGPEYWYKYSAQALAINKFVEASGVRKSVSPAFNNAKGKNRRPFYQVMTHHNALEDVDKIPYPLSRKSMKRRKIKLIDHKVDSLKKGVYQRMNLDSDGFVLGRHSKDVIDHWDGYFLDTTDTWCSLCVDKQLRVETSENKLFEVIDGGTPFIPDLSKKDKIGVESQFIDHIKKIDPKVNPWLKLIEFTRYLNEKGFVKQELPYLLEQHDPNDKNLAQKLREKLKAFSQAPETEIPNYKLEEFGKDRTDLFEVTVLGSASTRVDSYVKEAEDLGYWMASMGMHIRTGGGRYGIMGAVARGVLKFMDQNPELADQCHLSAIQMPRTIQFEGVSIKPEDCADESNKHLCVEPSFDHRMESLFRSDSLVAMAPGIGTYQEMVRRLRLKVDGKGKPFANKLMLYNQKQANENGSVRLMDVFLRGLLPRKYHDDISEVLDLKAVKAQISREYEEKMGHPPVPLITKNTMDTNSSMSPDFKP